MCSRRNFGSTIICLVLVILLFAGCVRPDQRVSSIQTAGGNTTGLENPLITPDRSIPKEGPAFALLPDSELVFGPSTVGFDVFSFIQSQKGYLNQYREEVNGEQLDGAAMLTRLSREYSVNPRLLLVLLEYFNHWVTQPIPGSNTDFPLGLKDGTRAGLYRQLSWAANTLNRGYYTRKVNALNQITLADGQVVNLTPSLNPGSAAVQYYFAQIYGFHDWELAVSPLGLYATFTGLFGDPAALSIGPVVPADIKQPPMNLPFRVGDVWNLSSGPHSAWGDGAAWAALDFIPPGGYYGCTQSKSWVMAAADGLVIRSENGMVVQDLNKDGYEQTGWTLIYQHIATQDRVPFGTMLEAGDRIGHPSCEGGPSNGTHLHFARRYNGEWIPADQELPFDLDGWISQGNGKEYDGQLIRDGVIVEAYGYITQESQISR
jgi:LasA protease